MNFSDEEILIIGYQPKYQQAFRDLNVEWISKYFKMESGDYAALDDPQGYILDKGGHIFVGIYQNKPVGVCAIIKMKDDPEYDFELAKMAVSPFAQGKSIGYLLGNAALRKAQSLGARGVYLESNRILTPAINLYLKLGFIELQGRTSPYERSDIQMGVKFGE
jgi:GNAT superfamily N-acetyltransferase